MWNPDPNTFLHSFKKWLDKPVPHRTYLRRQSAPHKEVEPILERLEKLSPKKKEKSDDSKESDRKRTRRSAPLPRNGLKSPAALRLSEQIRPIVAESRKNNTKKNEKTHEIGANEDNDQYQNGGVKYPSRVRKTTRKKSLTPDEVLDSLNFISDKSESESIAGSEDKFPAKNDEEQIDMTSSQDSGFVSQETCRNENFSFGGHSPVEEPKIQDSDSEVEVGRRLRTRRKSDKTASVDKSLAIDKTLQKDDKIDDGIVSKTDKIATPENHVLKANTIDLNVDNILRREDKVHEKSVHNEEAAHETMETDMDVVDGTALLSAPVMASVEVLDVETKALRATGSGKPRRRSRRSKSDVSLGETSDVSNSETSSVTCVVTLNDDVTDVTHVTDASAPVTEPVASVPRRLTRRDVIRRSVDSTSSEDDCVPLARLRITANKTSDALGKATMISAATKPSAVPDSAEPSFALSRLRRRSSRSSTSSSDDVPLSALRNRITRNNSHTSPSRTAPSSAHISPTRPSASHAHRSPQRRTPTKALDSPPLAVRTCPISPRLARLPDKRKTSPKPGSRRHSPKPAGLNNNTQLSFISTSPKSGTSISSKLAALNNSPKSGTLNMSPTIPLVNISPKSKSSAVLASPKKSQDTPVSPNKSVSISKTPTKNLVGDVASPTKLRSSGILKSADARPSLGTRPVLVVAGNTSSSNSLPLAQIAASKQVQQALKSHHLLTSINTADIANNTIVVLSRPSPGKSPAKEQSSSQSATGPSLPKEAKRTSRRLAPSPVAMSEESESAAEQEPVLKVTVLPEPMTLTQSVQRIVSAVSGEFDSSVDEVKKPINLTPKPEQVISPRKALLNTRPTRTSIRSANDKESEAIPRTVVEDNKMEKSPRKSPAIDKPLLAHLLSSAFAKVDPSRRHLIRGVRVARNSSSPSTITNSHNFLISRTERDVKQDPQPRGRSKPSAENSSPKVVPLSKSIPEIEKVTSSRSQRRKRKREDTEVEEPTREPRQAKRPRRESSSAKSLRSVAKSSISPRKQLLPTKNDDKIQEEIVDNSDNTNLEVPMELDNNNITTETATTTTVKEENVGTPEKVERNNNDNNDASSAIDEGFNISPSTSGRKLTPPKKLTDYVCKSGRRSRSLSTGLSAPNRRIKTDPSEPNDKRKSRELRRYERYFDGEPYNVMLRFIQQRNAMNSVNETETKRDNSNS